MSTKQISAQKRISYLTLCFAHRNLKITFFLGFYNLVQYTVNKK